jgi:hypothetical protein
VSHENTTTKVANTETVREREVMRTEMNEQGVIMYFSATSHHASCSSLSISLNTYEILALYLPPSPAPAALPIPLALNAIISSVRLWISAWSGSVGAVVVIKPKPSPPVFPEFALLPDAFPFDALLELLFDPS